MALANNKIPYGSTMSSKFQTSVFDETAMEINSLQKSLVEEEDGSQTTNGLSNDSASATALSSPPPPCSNNGYAYKSTNYPPEEAESLIDFKAKECSSNIMQGSESLLSFQQSWLVSNEDNSPEGYDQWNHVSPKSTTSLHMMQGFSGYSSIFNNEKEKQHDESSYGWLYSETEVPGDRLLETATRESVLRKRSSMVLLCFLGYMTKYSPLFDVLENGTVTPNRNFFLHRIAFKCSSIRPPLKKL